MIKNLTVTIIQICFVFLISYALLIAIILATNPRYIALACINFTLLIATAAVVHKQAKQLFLPLNYDFFLLGVVYSLLTAALWWLVITLFFSVTGGNRFVDVIEPSLPEFAYSFVAIFVCCLLTYLLLKENMLEETNRPLRTRLVVVGLSSIFTVGIAIAMLWLFSSLITMLG